MPSPRPYLIALVAAVILNLGLRLRIPEHVLRAQVTAPRLLLELRNRLVVLFALLLVGFSRLLLVAFAPTLAPEASCTSPRQLGGLVQLASGMAAANLISENLTINQIFSLFGGFAVLGFLLVYGLVAVSSLRVPLTGNSRSPRVLVRGGRLKTVTGMVVAYLSGAAGEQNQMLLTFVAFVPLGVIRVWRFSGDL